MAQESFIRRRVPAIERKISDIQPEMDVRVRLTGTVIDTSPGSLLLDDGTGKIEILFDEPFHAIEGNMVKIIARILPLIDGFECRGECLQHLNGFDLKLYKKAKEVIKNI